MKQYTLFLLGITLVLASCRKCEEERAPIPTPYQETSAQIEEWIANGELPPATQTGEHTMGCLINGVPWMPIDESPSGNFSFDIVFNLSSSGNLNINGFKPINESDDYLKVSGSLVFDENYNYPMTLGTGGGSFIDFEGNCGAFFYDSTYIDRNLNLTKVDFDSNIISGLFTMRLVNESCQDTILITEGRFDLQGD